MEKERFWINVYLYGAVQDLYVTAEEAKQIKQIQLDEIDATMARRAKLNILKK